MEQLPVILGGLILAGILWLVKTTTDHKSDLAVIKTTLTGATGDNGLVGDMKALRSSVHDMRGVAQEHETRITLLENA